MSACVCVRAFYMYAGWSVWAASTSEHIQKVKLYCGCYAYDVWQFIFPFRWWMNMNWCLVSKHNDNNNNKSSTFSIVEFKILQNYLLGPNEVEWNASSEIRLFTPPNNHLNDSHMFGRPRILFFFSSSSSYYMRQASPVLTNMKQTSKRLKESQYLIKTLKFSVQKELAKRKMS